MEIALEPKSPAEAEGLYRALLEMMQRDPPIRGRPDHESGLFMLCGDSEPELDAVLDELINVRKIGINVGAPQVAYVETLGRAAEIDYTLRSRPGDHFARVQLLFEPGDAYAFESHLDAAALPTEFLEGIERGVEAARSEGLLAGFKVVDFKVTLLDAAYHDTDSSAASFEIAAHQAFKQLRDQAEPRLIWPVMALYIATPPETLLAVQADLRRKRLDIAAIDQTDQAAELEVFAPLANLFGYADTLRDLTGGQAICTMRFARYEPVPAWPGPDDLYPSDIGMRA